MSQVIIHNGEVVNRGEKRFGTQNRAWRYGDGLFESIRVVEGHICFFNDHYDRLVKGMNYLEMDGDHLTKDFLLGQLNKLIELNRITKGGTIRLQVFRASGGLYTPLNDGIEWVAEAETFADNFFSFNEQGIRFSIYQELVKPLSPLSIYKTANALLYIKASKFKQKHHLDECLLLNQADRIAEGSASNVFLTSKSRLFTPPIEEGCLDGVMRKQVIKLARFYGLEVKEVALDKQVLEQAEEVFFTNTSRGIRWAASYKSKRYFNKTARFLTEMLNKQLLNYLSAA